MAGRLKIHPAGHRLRRRADHLGRARDGVGRGRCQVAALQQLVEGAGAYA